MKYWIVLNDEQAEPFEAGQLPGQGVTRSTLVWNETMERWTAAGEVEELRRILPPLVSDGDMQEEGADDCTEEYVRPSSFLVVNIVLSVLSFLLPVFFVGFFNEIVKDSAWHYCIDAFLPLLWMSIGLYIGIPGIVFSVLTKVFGNVRKAKPARIFSILAKVWMIFVLVFNILFLALSFVEYESYGQSDCDVVEVHVESDSLEEKVVQVDGVETAVADFLWKL